MMYMVKDFLFGWLAILLPSLAMNFWGYPRVHTSLTRLALFPPNFSTLSPYLCLPKNLIQSYLAQANDYSRIQSIIITKTILSLLSFQTHLICEVLAINL